MAGAVISDVADDPAQICLLCTRAHMPRAHAAFHQGEQVGLLGGISGDGSWYHCTGPKAETPIASTDTAVLPPTSHRRSDGPPSAARARVASACCQPKSLAHSAHDARDLVGHRPPPIGGHLLRPRTVDELTHADDVEHAPHGPCAASSSRDGPARSRCVPYDRHRESVRRPSRRHREEKVRVFFCYKGHSSRLETLHRCFHCGACSLSS